MLTKADILAYMKASPVSQRLVITPLLDPAQIGPSSIDLRLGFSFLVSRRANLESIDPMELDDETSKEKCFERMNISRAGRLVLHPGEFVLGASLEYVGMPDTLGAYVTSRSSWGRTGLVIATATSVAPGFRGCITLELANLGTAPLILKPGVRIAQIIFHESSSRSTYEGRYRCPTGPELGRIQKDPELAFWRGV